MINTQKFIKTLQYKLGLPLPGLEAQMNMVPITRQREKFKTKLTTPPKEGAVLILLYPKMNTLHLVFIKKPKFRGVHSSQIALPGGKHEETDNSLTETALREANEEIGIKASNIKILGQLTKIFIPPSNFNVLPVIAYTEIYPEFIPDKKEVAKVIEVPLELLKNPETIQHKKVLPGDGLKVSVPCYYIYDEIIWGATAMIISEFLEIIKDCHP